MSQPITPKKLLLILTLAVVLMFGFAFALVPLYDTLCRALGINGKVGPYIGSPITSTQDTDENRTVDIEFFVTKNHVPEWTFYPVERKLPVIPGQSYRVDFYAKNHSDQAITIQAIPNITPTQGAMYMQKTECFCFTQQTLMAGEETTMPVIFIVDPDLPDKFSTLTLAYTLYPLDQ